MCHRNWNMRTYNIFNSFLCEIYRDDCGCAYLVYVCNRVLSIKILFRTECIYQLPFENCCCPKLVKHHQRLVLAYLEKSVDNNYYLRFLFPLQNCMNFSPKLQYMEKPSYALYVLEGELFLSTMCKRRYRAFHLRFEPADNSYSLQKLPFYG